MTNDRRVYARLQGAGWTVELVRYNRAGKWFKEWTPVQLKSAEKLTMADVVRQAKEWKRIGGEVFYGVPGGSTFDRKMREDEE